MRVDKPNHHASQLSWSKFSETQGEPGQKPSCRLILDFFCCFTRQPRRPQISMLKKKNCHDGYRGEVTNLATLPNKRAGLHLQMYDRLHYVAPFRKQLQGVGGRTGSGIYKKEFRRETYKTNLDRRIFKSACVRLHFKQAAAVRMV